MEQIITGMSSIGHFLLSLPFSTATWFIICILAFFVWLFVQGDKNPNSPVQWEHLIVDYTTNRTSPYKLGYLIGLVVSTWVVISLMDRSALTIDIFGIYLTYLVGGAGFNEWLKHGGGTAGEFVSKSLPPQVGGDSSLPGPGSLPVSSPNVTPSVDTTTNVEPAT
jgi:hypothetical protein